MEEKELSTTISASPVNSESDVAVTQPPNNHHQNDIVFDNNKNSVVSPNNNNMSIVGIVTSEGGLSFGSTTIKEKKKRGRPRKYDADGNLRVSYTSPQTQTTPFSLSPMGSDQFSQSSVVKRGRGRPSGSGNWQILASLGEMFASTAGGDFTPHVVTVSTGEDVASKIMSFAEKGSRGICVLSANGAVSNVTIRQPGSSGGILTYEGRFEILSLSGSLTVTEISGGKSRTGGLSVSLAGPDGRVIGGGLAGLLTAASPIQIVVGSFIPNGYKTQKRKYNKSESNVASSPILASETVTFANPISQAKPAFEATPIPGPNPTLPPPITTTFLSPPIQVQPNTADQKPMISSSSTTMSGGVKESPNNFAVWNGPPESHHRSPDINVSVPADL